MGCCASSDFGSVTRGARQSPATLDSQNTAQHDSITSDKFDAVDAFGHDDCPPVQTPVLNTPDRRSSLACSLDNTLTGTQVAQSKAPHHHRGSASTLNNNNNNDIDIDVAAGRPRALAPDRTPPQRLTVDALRRAAKVGSSPPTMLAGLSARQKRRLSRNSTPGLAACRSNCGAATTLHDGASPERNAIAMWVEDEGARFVTVGNPLELDAAPLTETNFMTSHARRLFDALDEDVRLDDPATGSSQRMLSQSAVAEWLATAACPSAP